MADQAPEDSRIDNEVLGTLIKDCIEAIVPVLPKGIGFTILLSHIVLPSGDLQIARGSSLSEAAVRMVLDCELNQDAYESTGEFADFAIRRGN